MKQLNERMAELVQQLPGHTEITGAMMQQVFDKAIKSSGCKYHPNRKGITLLNNEMYCKACTTPRTL